MQHLFVSINEYLSRRKATFFVLLILLLGIAGYLASRVKLEENLNAIIPEDTRISKISSVFDKSELADQIVFILSCKDTSLVSPGTLINSAERLTGVLEKDTALVARINFKAGNEEMMEVYDFIYNHLPLFLTDEDYGQIGEMLTPAAIDRIIQKDFKHIISPAGMATGDYILRDPLSLTPLALTKMKQFQLDDNFMLYQSAIFTLDRKNLLFFLDPAYPSSNTRENLKLIQLIDHTVADLEEELSATRVQYYGGTAVAVANSVRVKKDIALTVSIAVLFFLVIFLAFFRRIRIIVLLFMPVVIGAGVSVAVLTLIYGEVSAIALGVGVIFIGITVDYSLHLFTHLRSCGSVRETIRRISTAILMSSLTTASAFLCLTIIRSEAMNQIGIFAAFAVVISALSVLVVTPLIIAGKQGLGKSWRLSDRTTLLEKAVSFPFEKARWLVAAIILFTVLFGFTSRKLRFNGDISTLNYQTSKLDEAEARLNSISSVASSSVYLVTQGKTLEEALLKLESNKDLFRTGKEDGLVSQVSSVSEMVLSEQAQRERIAAWNRFWQDADARGVEDAIRESGKKYHFKEDAFSQFFDLLHRPFEPIPVSDYGILTEQFLDNYIGEEDGTWSLVTILKVDSGDKEPLFARFSANEDFIIFDNQYFINQFFDVLKEDFNKLVLVSMIVVFFILLVFFGRIEIALITFIPIIISWTWALGLMGVFNIQFNIFNIIISTFIFGLGIDYCIFIMNGIITGYREGNHNLGPYKLSILLSALTTITGIGVLVFARHPALKSIAFVSIFGISTVVLISYTLLPLLFSFLTMGRGKPRLQPLNLIHTLVSLVPFFLFLGCAFIVTLLIPVFMALPVRRQVKKRIISQIIYLFSKFIVGISFFVKKKYIDRDLFDFSKPSVIVSNHQSQLDLVFLLSQHPKMIVLVNKWVWNNPFYGPIIRFADFYPVYKGLDYDLEKIGQKVADGYSILAFPEASRSPDGEIRRFHQGAFGIADLLGLEVQPVMIHGAYHSMPKSELFIKPGQVTLKCFPRVIPRAMEHEGMKTFHRQAREMTAFYRKEFQKLKTRQETPRYFSSKLVGQFVYKGPVLEWYLKVKLLLENNYQFYHDTIPGNAKVVDIGCGYGFLSIMLGYLPGNRQITGIDYDGEKIRVASNIARDMERVSFLEADITREELPRGEVYILNDVLHYLPEESQFALLDQCLSKMPAGGMVILRDADSNLPRRTLVTKLTEFQSTRLFKFNKASHPLTYLPARSIEDFVSGRGYAYTRLDRTRFTSNITYIITGKTDIIPRKTEING